ncbi:hypothetical protein [Bacillus pseudomycoides]|uniref:hypothetical protein n=1 Tax=Bacillus pseudomycoides TaxID=64104 RepID=UPI0004ED7361|nr:hypothetical protein [Bacillus pseudomycoides]AIK36538.1 hypothetical protein DJ92_4723 [Bacillus pseudomycoides]AJI15470.1 hypothetical protein BG07_223 [Bacillus pseudomycoides]PEB38313.1 hypothetical protein COO06_29380 [Bacillus pseudomycoides]PEK38294.1 hypothetical protein CN691_05570 [Bacillus pseudomycoides]PEK68709.1 hypothetical protein CN593_11345 [Bacillus pseudomycoides]
MKYFGDKETFAVAYELKESPFDKSGKIEPTWGIFQMWVNNKSVCTFSMSERVCEYEWDLFFIVEWLYKNKNNIFNETQFPLPIEGSNSIEFYKNSGDFDSDDDDEFDLWFEKRQDWYFRHSWYSHNGGSFLADVIFRRVENTIEIAWDNSNLYSEIKFINPKGIYYVPFELFQGVINNFIEDFMLKVSENEEGKKVIEKLQETF